MRDVKPAAAALNTVLRIVHMGATQIENVITCRENVFANQPCAENSLGTRLRLGSHNAMMGSLVPRPFFATLSVVKDGLGTRLVDGYGCGLGLGEFF